MPSREKIIADLVPQIYDSSVREFRYPSPVDMSRSDKCHTMTLDLFRALGSRGISVRRELHQTTEGYWHYIINHNVTTNPSDTDTITDLNPWAFPDSAPHTGYLHGERHYIQDILRTAGAPETYVALRGLATITALHSERLLPFPPLQNP